MGADKKRIVFLFSVLCLGFMLVLSKAVYVQVINKESLLEYSKSQILRETKVYPNRGNIYDRNGSPLALNIQTYSIFTIPKNIKGGWRAYRELSKIVPELSFNKIREKINNRTGYTWLGRKIQLSKKQVEAVRRLAKEYDGIYIEAVPTRVYPNNELLSQVLGFVGVDNTGLSGVELRYDKELRGNAQRTKYIQDAKGRPVKFESYDVAGQAGEIYLTIDKGLQAISEKFLREAVLKYNARMGGVGVMDVKTGEVLVMANYPSFDPNKVSNSKAEHRKISFVTDPFEPGSIFKTLTIASALENKVATLKSNYYCEQGSLKVGNHTITEAESKKHFEWMSVADILVPSSNVGTTKIAFDLSFPTLKKTLTDFKIGERLGIEISGESRGIFTSKKNVTPLTLSNISFGQGVATTALQMMSAYATIANGGVYVKPTIVRSVNGSTNEPVRERIISEKTAEDLIKALVDVVEKGTGISAKIPHFKIAGKTGTAQRVNSSGGYSGYIPNFIGFPVNVLNRFVVMVYVDDPKGNEYYGGVVAAPVFKKVVEYLLYKEKNFKQLADKKHGATDLDTFDKIDVVKRKTASTKNLDMTKVPNFLGLDKISSGDIAEKIGVAVKHIGSGIVSDQVPGHGAPIEKNMTIQLYYTAPKYE